MKLAFSAFCTEADSEADFEALLVFCRLAILILVELEVVLEVVSGAALLSRAVPIVRPRDKLIAVTVIKSVLERRLLCLHIVIYRFPLSNLKVSCFENIQFQRCLQSEGDF